MSNPRIFNSLKPTTLAGIVADLQCDDVDVRYEEAVFSKQARAALVANCGEQEAENYIANADGEPRSYRKNEIRFGDTRLLLTLEGGLELWRPGKIVPAAKCNPDERNGDLDACMLFADALRIAIDDARIP